MKFFLSMCVQTKIKDFNEFHYKITCIRWHTCIDVFGWMTKTRITSCTHFFWLIDKIRPEEIDGIISTEISNMSTDKLLFDIVPTNMIHGPYGNLNSSSLYMADGKCTKISPKEFNDDTITNVDGYSIYLWRNIDNGEQSFTKNF